MILILRVKLLKTIFKTIMKKKELCMKMQFLQKKGKFDFIRIKSYNRKTLIIDPEELIVI